MSIGSITTHIPGQGTWGDKQELPGPLTEVRVLMDGDACHGCYECKDDGWMLVVRGEQMCRKKVRACNYAYSGLSRNKIRLGR